MKTEKDIEEILDNVKIPSDEEVEAAGMRFDHRIRRLRMRRRLMWATGSVAAVLCCGLVFTSLWMNRGAYSGGYPFSISGDIRSVPS